MMVKSLSLTIAFALLLTGCNNSSQSTENTTASTTSASIVAPATSRAKASQESYVEVSQPS